MDRKDFLVSISKSAAFICIAGCIGACSDEESNPSAPSNIDFTVDLSAQENTALNSPGGYVYRNSIIIANIGNNTFAAVSQVCTHQGFTLVYELNNNRFHCNNHGSNFDNNGNVINGPASRALVRYNTELNGNVLRIFS